MSQEDYETFLLEPGYGTIDDYCTDHNIPADKKFALLELHRMQVDYQVNGNHPRLLLAYISAHKELYDKFRTDFEEKGLPRERADALISLAENKDFFKEIGDIYRKSILPTIRENISSELLLLTRHSGKTNKKNLH